MTKVTTKVLLKRLESWLIKHRAEAFETMNPGLGKTEISAFEQKLKIKFPSSVKTYFSWRDGQDSDKEKYKELYTETNPGFPIIIKARYN